MRLKDFLDIAGPRWECKVADHWYAVQEDAFLTGGVFFEKKILITAGPTYEMIDPVRFIGNFSSGKMGFSLAKKASEMGATVFLISGPSNESVKGFNVEIKKVNSKKRK